MQVLIIGCLLVCWFRLHIDSIDLTDGSLIALVYEKGVISGFIGSIAHSSVFGVNFAELE